MLIRSPLIGTFTRTSASNRSSLHFPEEVSLGVAVEQLLDAPVHIPDERGGVMADSHGAVLHQRQ